jgi:hypothetical protein
LKQDRNYDLLIEGGDLTIDGTALDELKLYTILNVLDDREARYDAVGVGPNDLRIDPETLGIYLEAFQQLHFISADLVPGDGLPWTVTPFVDHVVANGTKVRVVGLTMALPDGPGEDSGTFRLRPPAEAWSLAMRELPADALRVAIAHGSMPAVRELAKLDPRPDLIVAANDAHAEPLREPELADGVPIVHPGTRGRFLLDVTLTRIDGDPRIVRHEAIPLQGSRTAKGALEDPATRELVLQHRFEAKEDGVLEKLADRLPTPTGAGYVGSASCMGCHLEAWESWQASKHHSAWETLVQAEATGRYAWPVTHYPDCVECHTVGYGEQTGFVNPERTPELRGVGCEECHGPASRHVSDPETNALGDVLVTKCTQCHDFEQSPDFDYHERWQRIEHR